MTAQDVYQCGHKGLKISRSQLNGKIRRKFCAKMKEAGASGVALLKGGEAFTLHNTDNEYVFRQEAYFLYLFGVLEESYMGAIDIDSGKTILFMPRLPAEYAVWMGHIATPDETRAKHGVDECYYTEEVADVLGKMNPSAVHILDGKNSDSGLCPPVPQFEGMDKLPIKKDIMFNVLTECRVHKLPEELEVMRWASKVASAAHVACMQRVTVGDCEYDIEATFMYECYSKGGARKTAYTPICAAGSNGATLHYGHVGAPNDSTLRDGDICLCDMGCEYYGYDSDITCSWPANGKFSTDQVVVYNAVLAANKGVIKAIKPGVKWPDMHRLAERTILSGLKGGGILQGEVEEMMEVHLGAVFMPHGLGHLIGIDTHDVGGYMPHTPERIQLPGIKNLRTARVLEAGMVVTVEPGCYFNDYLLKQALANPAQAKFLVEDRIKTLMDFGGVRIEDNVIVTDTGSDSMTDVPRTIEEVEAVCAGGAWPTGKANGNH